MTSPAIQVHNLTKWYGPSGLSFSVPRGSICGFLGPNGSGKTTTLRILMGLAHAASGSAHVLGVPAGTSNEIFRQVAFVPEVKDLYQFARAEEMIRLTRGFYPNWDHSLERRLIDEFEIPLRMKCPKLSKGTKAKLYLLLALCRRPELLVLDEPTEGLDPIAIEQTLRLLVEQVAERGATVFFSSHQLARSRAGGRLRGDDQARPLRGRGRARQHQAVLSPRALRDGDDRREAAALPVQLASRGPLPHRLLRG